MSTNMAERSSLKERSGLKEFLASILTIKGDLSNITAPPFVLATQSTVEFPSYWAEHPDFFLAPASEPDPAKRALLVLRWFLASLRNQQYGGRDEKDGIKKPLNAFLGELFLARSEDGTRLIAEQVSHHPPVTACYLYNEQAGIRAEGYACQEITFNGSVHVKQTGHAVLHLDEFNEDYLIPMLNLKIKGILTGSPYPELVGQYHITSSSGFVSEIDFSGKGFFSGRKNTVCAILYKQEPAGDEKKPLFTIAGQWNDQITVHQGDQESPALETININTLQSSPMHVDILDQQDPWESRKAWAGVIAALNAGDMKATAEEKSKVENAQRRMRKMEVEKGVQWEPLFFSKLHSDRDQVVEYLAAELIKEGLFSQSSGMWKFNTQLLQNGPQKPFHGNLIPGSE